MTWAPVLADLMGPASGRRAREGDVLVQTQDLVWAGLARAGIAAGRALHAALAGGAIDRDRCAIAGEAATAALAEAMELRGVERGIDRGTVDRGRLWTMQVRHEFGHVAATLVFEQGVGADHEVVAWTWSALWFGFQLGMSYPARRVPA